MVIDNGYHYKNNEDLRFKLLPVNQWTTNEVFNWLNLVGFKDYAKLIAIQHQVLISR